MDNAGYVGLTRMKGLQDELRVIANNIANASTTGYRGEGLLFAEALVEADVDGGALAMAQPRAHRTDPSPGGMARTGGDFDLAINGDGYFQVQGANGPRLTRAGAFTMGPNGELLNPRGEALLDAGGAPVQLPPGVASFSISEDGVISGDGQQFGQIGLFTMPPERLLREDGVNFRFEGQPEPAPEARVSQGFLEQSNVSGVEQMARMIEVQRAYEIAKNLQDQDDQLQREAVRTLGRVG